MQTKVKMCGLSRMEDIGFVNELKPDYIGFVFFPKSKRNVSFDKALELRKGLSKDLPIKVVGVFVDADKDFVVKLVKHNVIDIVQLHGSEDEAYVKELKAKLYEENLKPQIIKAFSIKSSDDLKKAESFPSDYVLLDHGAGGTGESFDWSLIKDFKKPYFLAGGLNPSNIEKAISLLSPFAIDLSSGLETDGVKDFSKMSAVMQIMRA